MDGAVVVGVGGLEARGVDESRTGAGAEPCAAERRRRRGRGNGCLI